MTSKKKKAWFKDKKSIIINKDSWAILNKLKLDAGLDSMDKALTFILIRFNDLTKSLREGKRNGKAKNTKIHRKKKGVALEVDKT